MLRYLHRALVIWCATCIVPSLHRALIDPNVLNAMGNHPFEPRFVFFRKRNFCFTSGVERRNHQHHEIVQSTLGIGLRNPVFVETQRAPRSPAGVEKYTISVRNRALTGCGGTWGWSSE